MQWIASVEKIEELKPEIVVAGHQRPDARDDDPAQILGDTKTYIRDFDQSLSESHSAQELVGNSRFGTTVEPAYGAMDATGGPRAQA